MRTRALPIDREYRVGPDADSVVTSINGEDVIVSRADIPVLNSKYWRLQGQDPRHRYIVRQTGAHGNRSLVLFHRVIANAPDGMCVDHINGNTRDNRRSNLRVCTHRENLRNRKKHATKNEFKGVYQEKGGGFFVVACGAKGGRKTVRLSGIRDKAIAVLLFDLITLSSFGQFARPNLELGDILRMANAQLESLSAANQPSFQLPSLKTVAA
jgi:hypothetical protein